MGTSRCGKKGEKEIGHPQSRGMFAHFSFREIKKRKRGEKKRRKKTV